MKNKLLIAGVVVTGLVALILMITEVVDSTGTPEPMKLDPRQTGGSGVPQQFIICDDGAVVPDTIGKPLIVDGQADPYKYEVPGHGIGYIQYECAQNPGKMWAYGKDGQTTSPYAR